MNLQDYQDKLKDSQEISNISEHILELIEIFCDLADTKTLSYYKYEYEFNEFFHQLTFDNDLKKISNSIKSEKNYKIFLKSENIVYGYFQIQNRIKSSNTLKKVLKKIVKYLKKEKDLQKKIYGNDVPFNIYLIQDGVDNFANNIKSGLEALFNAEVYMSNSLHTNLDKINKKDSKNVILFLINEIDDIKIYEDELKSLNELVIVLGPNDHNISMYCGSLGINDYLCINNFKVENLKNIILNKRNNLVNKNRFGNRIIGLCGISGGIGTTTLAMNTASLIANNQPNKNVLFIDLATTKAISNLFLEKNPLPSKTIVDLVNSSEFNLESNLENGLVKVKENFFAITGIQKHIDKEFLEKDAFIEKLLNYISSCSEYFNIIIIDMGVTDASNLKSTIYDIVNELWLVTQMTLPDISKLKTFYSLMKRAGLKDKISFLVNRYDSQNAISINDVSSILNMNSEDKIQFDNFKLPNDYKALGKSWNYCELVTKDEPNSPFVKKLNLILEEKSLYVRKEEKVESSGLFSFFKRDKK